MQTDYIFSPIQPPTDGDASNPETSLKLDCETGYGTAVTGAFGFQAAALAVNLVAAEA